VCDGAGRTVGDEKLLAYLYKNRHDTPFEMAGIVLEVQAPIFVFREWHRHRTQSYNELSARYTPMPNIHYLPTPERCLAVDGKNKQAGSIMGMGPTHEQALAWLQDLESLYVHSEEVYQRGLSVGVPKEIARTAVLVSRYSRMRASTNLRNWLGFMTLRSAENAQKEIQVYSNAIASLVADLFPRTWSLFSAGR
jgi:thymidylate synthase (FAD)